MQWRLLYALVLLSIKPTTTTATSNNNIPTCARLRSEQTETYVKCVYGPGITKQKKRKCITQLRQNIRIMTKRNNELFTKNGGGSPKSGCSKQFSSANVVQLVDVCQKDHMDQDECMKLVQFYIGLKVTSVNKEDETKPIMPPICSGGYTTQCMDGMFGCCKSCPSCDCDEPTTTTSTKPPAITTEPPTLPPNPPIEYDRILDLSNEDFPYPESVGYGRRVSLGGVEAFRLAVSPRYHAAATGNLTLDEFVRTKTPLAMVFEEESNSVWTNTYAPLFAPNGLLPAGKDDIGNIAILSRLEANLMLVRYNRGVEVDGKMINVGAAQAYIYREYIDLWEEIGDFLGGIDAAESIAGVALADKAPYFIAEFRDQSGQNSVVGKFCVYSIDEDGNITQIGGSIRGTIGKTSAFDLGTSVGISWDGRTVAVGFRLFGENCNSVAVFKLQGNEPKDYVWVQAGPSIKFEEEYCTGAHTLALHYGGLYVAVGSVQNEGLVRVYEFNGKEWDPKGNDLRGDSTMISLFGKSLSMDEKGHRIIVGAPDHNGPNGNRRLAGQVQIYQYKSDGIWHKDGEMYGESEMQRFGFSVSMDLVGFRVAVGSIGNGGKAAVYQYP